MAISKIRPRHASEGRSIAAVVKMCIRDRINTIRGNVDRMLAREETMYSPYLQNDMDKILPVVDDSGSDSAILDNTIEFLVMSGMELPLAMMITCLLYTSWRYSFGCP